MYKIKKQLTEIMKDEEIQTDLKLKKKLSSWI